MGLAAKLVVFKNLAMCHSGDLGLVMDESRNVEFGGGKGGVLESYRLWLPNFITYGWKVPKMVTKSPGIQQHEHIS